MAGRSNALWVIALFALACDDTSVVGLDPILRISPDHLDFGVVELGQDAELPVNITNLQQVPAVLTITSTDDCGGCFAALAVESPLLGSTDLQVRFRAVRLAVATGTVTIATNDPKLPIHKVTTIGRGSDLRKPDIEVIPPVVDFGFVPAGGIGIGSFAIRSTGTNDLIIDRIRIEPPGAPFKITTSTAGSMGMPPHFVPGEQRSLSLRATVPDTVSGTVTASVFIETNVLAVKNVPDHPGWVEVPLVANANLPPLAVVGPDQTVEPWSRATLDGHLSHDQDVPPNHPLKFQWELISRPDGSTTQLEHAKTATPSFWVDLTGHYEIGLVVTDTLGLESQNRAVTVVEALPTNAVRIELIWDHPDADLDLHLIRAGGAFCDCATDVHYRDCGRTPNWFPSNPGANPRLDVDDRSGFGPENINIDGDGPSRFIPPGAYSIAVHYYSSNSGVSSWPTKVANATVRVYIFGLLAAELSHAMENDGDLWFAGTLRWPERRVDDDGRVLGGQICAIL